MSREVTVTQEQVDTSAETVLIAASYGAHFGELHELITGSAKVCRALIAKAPYDQHQLTRMVAWSDEAMVGLEGREGCEATAAAMFVSALGTLAGERLKPVGRPC